MSIIMRPIRRVVMFCVLLAALFVRADAQSSTLIVHHNANLRAAHHTVRHPRSP